MKCSPAAVPARLASRGVVVSTAALLLTLVGCDQEAANRGEAARLLNEGIAVMLEADTAKPNDEQRLSDVRLGLLAGARGPLEQAASKGSPAQQAQANMLLARLEAQSAEALARAAAAGASNTRLTVTGLLGQLESIESLGATALIAERDPAQAIAQMDEAIADAEAKKSELSTQVAQLQTRVAELDGQIASQQDAARAAFAQKTQLESEAFVQEGPAKYETLRSATAAQRQADQADVKAQELSIARDQAGSELALAERELSLAESSLDQFLDTRDAFAQAGQDADRIVRELRSKQAELAETLVADVEQGVNAFDEAVTGPITNAVEEARAAVERVGRANAGLQGAQRQQQQMEELDKLHLLTQTLADAATYHADLQASLSAMAGRSVFEQSPGLRDKINALAGELQGAAQTFREQASEALATTREQLQAFDPESDTASGVRDAVARLASQLDAG